LSTKIISTETEVDGFLRDLKGILTDEEFDVSIDLDILTKKKIESPTDPYTTFNTLQALSFDRNDVVKQLLSLDASDYIETFIDDKDNTLPPFYTFGKDISNREVYIKVKIRDKKRRKVFCVSFHFARYPLSSIRPYA
jgi:hypothetical protein